GGGGRRGFVFRTTPGSDAGRRRDDQHDTQAGVEVAGAGIVCGSGGRAATEGSVEPRAAALHAPAAGARAGRVLRRTGLVVIHVVHVLTPLPGIAVHVVKTPRILLQSSHRPWMTLRVAGEPCVIQ